MNKSWTKKSTRNMDFVSAVRQHDYHRSFDRYCESIKDQGPVKVIVERDYDNQFIKSVDFDDSMAALDWVECQPMKGPSKTYTVKI